MVANALVQTRIDAEVKERATAVLDNIGLTVSDVMRIVLTRVAKEGALPAGFTVDAAAHDAWFRMRKLKRILQSAAQLRCSKQVKVRREAGLVAIGDG